MAITAPDRYFAHVSQIDVRDDIVDAGFTHVLLDMDNTLFSRESKQVPFDVRAWLGKLQRADVAVCLLSNNWHKTPYQVAEDLDLPVVAKALKPLPHAFILARGKIGARSATTVVIGDQVTTDVVGAHMLGMKAYLVCPLAGNDALTTRISRGFEQLVLSGRVPEGLTGVSQTVEPAGSTGVSHTVTQVVPAGVSQTVAQALDDIVPSARQTIGEEG